MIWPILHHCHLLYLLWCLDASIYQKICVCTTSPTSWIFSTKFLPYCGFSMYLVAFSYKMHDDVAHEFEGKNSRWFWSLLRAVDVVSKCMLTHPQYLLYTTLQLILELRTGSSVWRLNIEPILSFNPRFYCSFIWSGEYWYSMYFIRLRR